MADKTSGVLPVLGQLLEQSATTQYAYLCHPAVQHISKLRREGKCLEFRIKYSCKIGGMGI